MKISKQLALEARATIEIMAIDRASLESLRDLVADASLMLETSPDLPQNRTANCRESLAA